jgi:hypothetical protein
MRVALALISWWLCFMHVQHCISSFTRRLLTGQTVERSISNISLANPELGTPVAPEL